VGSQTQPRSGMSKYSQGAGFYEETNNTSNADDKRGECKHVKHDKISPFPKRGHNELPASDAIHSHLLSHAIRFDCSNHYHLIVCSLSQWQTQLQLQQPHPRPPELQHPQPAQQPAHRMRPPTQMPAAADSHTTRNCAENCETHCKRSG
jgi:hypothetical protein